MKFASKCKTLCYKNLIFGYKFIAVVTVLLTVALSGCSEKPQPIFRVGTNVWPGYELLYLARDLGYYKNSSIKLVDYPSASEVIRAYRHGTIEAAALTMDEVFLLAEQDEYLKVILIMDFSNGGDVVIAKPEIRELSDLRGKRIGVETTALGAFMLTRALEHAEMNNKDVSIVPLEVNGHETAYKTGKVDAVVTFEPIRSNLLSAGANILFDSSEIPGEIVDVLVVRGDLLENRKDTVHTLMQGWFKALDYLGQNPEEASRRMAPREGVTPKQFMASLEGIQIPDRNENIRLLSDKNSELFKSMANLSRIMIDSNLLMKPANPALFLESKLVKEIK